MEVYSGSVVKTKYKSFLSEPIPVNGWGRERIPDYYVDNSSRVVPRIHVDNRLCDVDQAASLASS